MDFLKKTVIIFALFFIPVFSFAQTSKDLPWLYQTGHTIKILIVPGHDDQDFGTIFQGVREADLNLVLAGKLATELRKDSQLSITVSRDTNGYTKELSDYFNNNRNSVESFYTRQKNITDAKIANGVIVPTEQVIHQTATPEIAYKLLATNMWTDEQGYNLVINVHFNDYGSRKISGGIFDGYVVYVPDNTLPNHEPAKTVGTDIAKRLGDIWNASNASTELKKINSDGVIEDSDLLALGSNETLQTPSILIEYAYIYEPIISTRFFDLSSTAMAHATVLGLDDYFLGKRKETPTFSYDWRSNLILSQAKKTDVLALQYALSELGFYPPSSKGRNSCPFTGIFGACTKNAVKVFQTTNDIVNTGGAGPQTRSVLNSLF